MRLPPSLPRPGLRARRLSLFLLAALLALLPGGCARLPAEEAADGPAASAARTGFAALSAHGVPLGSALAVAPDRLLTNAHVLPEGATRLQARRGDGAAVVEAVVLARSPGMDLAVLAVAPGVFLPVPRQAGPPRQGQAIWAIGAPAAGPALAQGVVEQPETVLGGRGPGFTARIGALMGYSGGPALDAEGRVRGLVTALLRAGAAPALAALTGVDVVGLSQTREGREVFILSIDAAMHESERIAPRN
ncbi:trypsin-like peptidase domain-containing protein [Falsiroseomonas tokyonensis]|uniref:Trypsin-like peptidase domain-containing protein n=1 Tax=Falsiroseomonas tokyonensis TaxID=430521 RepID=A0ABV7C0X1_9PROT|nr:trypsin-like peptidase domain-containing protein [Falsiroseomonas tokyonensis]MBU8541519.1 trypsin-like peptidase domain-containing protein [Falsiroseomonas tokyonensis]